ncbi:MAG: hypothetical protein AAFX93_04295 [Verrucomicrobiota bacterium]
MASSQFPLLAQQLGVPLIGGDSYLPKIPILKLIKRPYRIEGPFRGHILKIYNYSQSNGGQNGSSTPYFAIVLELKNTRDLKFKLSSEGFFSKIGKALGMQDIQTGDPIFDETFVVKSSDTSFAREGLLPEIRQQFLTAKQQCSRTFGGIQLKNNNLRYDRVGHLSKEQDRTEAAMLSKAMADLADAIEIYHGAS